MKTVSIGDLRLAVEDRGESRAAGEPSSDKPVLLLVHGFPLDHTMWQSQIDYFSAHGRVIAPDLRGFGESSLGVSAEEVSIATYADDLAALLDRLAIDRPIVFCGLSMGGYIAWQFCAKYASRLCRAGSLRHTVDRRHVAGGRWASGFGEESARRRK